MTTAAVKAAAITFKIFFFIDHPFVGVEFSIFNMQSTGPTVSRITDGVDSHQSQFGPVPWVLRHVPIKAVIGPHRNRMKIEGLPVIERSEPHRH
jgi:hypothetical protein